MPNILIKPDFFSLHQSHSLQNETDSIVLMTFIESPHQLTVKLSIEDALTIRSLLDKIQIEEIQQDAQS